MFYYGLDFHDLAPDSVLLISTFIVTCEAFLRTPPYFGLWLKTFDVRPRVTEEEQAECDSVIIGKLACAIWFEGSFAESSGMWQQGWFYINEPRGSKWAATPVFRPSPPIQLASWIKKDWTGDPSMKCRLCKVASEALPRRASVL